jgi:hypothetical protein
MWIVVGWCLLTASYNFFKCVHPNGCGQRFTWLPYKKQRSNCWLIKSDTKLMNSELNWDIRTCVICCRFAPHTNETRLSLNEVWITSCLTCPDDSNRQNLDGFKPEFCILDLRQWLRQNYIIYTRPRHSSLRTLENRRWDFPCLTRYTSSGVCWLAGLRNSLPRAVPAVSEYVSLLTCAFLK